MIPLEGVWFILVALSFAVYVVLDGFDLGAGILHLRIAQTPTQRRLILKSIGPVWDGNEVWLLVAGATAYLAFPALYADTIAGFYLPVSIVLWLFLLRALGIEMKHHFFPLPHPSEDADEASASHALWDELWDHAFAGASLLLTLFLGVALGNIVRGFNLDENGRFFTPLWTDFTVSGTVGIFDWFTLTVGVTAVAALSLHGALWVAHRTEGPTAERAKVFVPPLLLTTAGGGLASTAGVFSVRSDLWPRALQEPWLFALPTLAALSLLAIVHQARRRSYLAAFLFSCGFIAAMVLAAAATIYPYVLPAREAGHGVLASVARSSDYSLRVGLAWWIPGVLLATSYFVFVYRKLPRTLKEEDVVHDDH